MITLYEYQVESANVLTRAMLEHSVALNASETGTGKTPVALEVAKRLGMPPAIISPKAVLPSWGRWCAEFQIKPVFIINYEKLKTGRTPYGNWDGKKWVWSDTLPENTMFIFDECHKAKGETSQNGRILGGCVGRPTLMISATIANSPQDLRWVGQLLGLHSGRDFYKFQLAHGCRQAPWRGLIFWGGQKHLMKLHHAIFPAKGHRVRIKDLGDKFPQNTIIAETYDIEDVAFVYHELDLALKRLEDKVEDDMEAPQTLLLRARQKAELLRCPLMADLAKQHAADGRSVVLFVNFRDSVTLLGSILETDCFIWGAQSAKVREGYIQDFQNNLPSAQYLIAQIDAGGVGIDLHDLQGRPRTSIISPTYSAEALRQALGRIYRAGSLSPAIQYLVYAADTIEESVCKAVRKKLSNLDTICDGDLAEASIPAFR